MSDNVVLLRRRAERTAVRAIVVLLAFVVSCSGGSDGAPQSSSPGPEGLPGVELHRSAVSSYPEVLSGEIGSETWSVEHRIEGSKTCLTVDYGGSSAESCLDQPTGVGVGADVIVGTNYRLAADAETMLVIGVVPLGTTRVSVPDLSSMAIAVDGDHGVFALVAPAGARAPQIEVEWPERSVTCDVDDDDLGDLVYFC
jgi:hypothetical protein